jgi:UDP-glucose 4-epimerase
LQLFGQKGTERDYLYIRDMAEGIAAALTGGNLGEVDNIDSGIGMDNREIIE